jgi:hypothetical protein
MPKLKVWILFSLIISLYSNSSELLSQSNQGKKHFIIVGSDLQYNDSLLREAVNNYAFLDAIRLENSRRTIGVEGTSLKVQLFSLNELNKEVNSKRKNALSQANLPLGEFIFSVSPRGKLKLIAQAK